MKPFYGASNDPRASSGVFSMIQKGLVLFGVEAVLEPYAGV